jgi:hypothetical protein
MRRAIWPARAEEVRDLGAQAGGERGTGAAPLEFPVSRAELLSQVLDEELPRYAEALRRLGE